MAHNMLRELCGQDWRPTGFLFAHRRPENVAPYRKHFGAPLVFNAEQYAVVFPSALLDRPLGRDDPELRRLLQTQLEAMEVRHGNDFVAHLRSVLRSALLTSRAGEDEIARLLSMHTRTLSRRLAASGTTFRRIVDECSFEIARQLLEFTRQDVAQIAVALDYADASAFTRAFRRWSGTTPARWRAVHAAAGNTAGLLPPVRKRVPMPAKSAGTARSQTTKARRSEGHR
jgi:AraC-like DNA-binding protein